MYPITAKYIKRGTYQIRIGNFICQFKEPFWNSRKMYSKKIQKLVSLLETEGFEVSALQVWVELAKAAAQAERHFPNFVLR